MPPRIDSPVGRRVEGVIVTGRQVDGDVLERSVLALKNFFGVDIVAEELMQLIVDACATISSLEHCLKSSNTYL